eukprot:sb/3471782/
MCNGVPDSRCQDEADEAHCENMSCQRRDWKSDDQHDHTNHLHKHQICDGVRDCKGNEDERMCDKEIECSRVYTTTVNNIPERWLCDGTLPQLPMITATALLGPNPPFSVRGERNSNRVEQGKLPPALIQVVLTTFTYKELTKQHPSLLLSGQCSDHSSRGPGQCSDITLTSPSPQLMP